MKTFLKYFLVQIFFIFIFCSNDYLNEYKTDIMIILKEKIKINSFLEETKNNSIDDRANILFEKLTALSKRTQKRIISFLEKENISFRTFRLSNVVK
jgi:hypothetical protein